MPRTVNDDLLEAVYQRQEDGGSQNEFNYGIITADRYVKNVRDCVGSDHCYKMIPTGDKARSFQDILTKASRTLTHNQPDMLVEDIYAEWKSLDLKDEGGENLILPKNTLMVIRHVLTTPRKDRDGDTLRTQGALVDPGMLLLWQHVHTLPVGKALGIAEHNSKRLVLYSAVVDVNDLSHDTAVMIENKMGRFSHGFKALEFDKIKAEGKQPGGFDVKRFEIMEESVVSVPANIDAEVEDVILSLVDGGKMTSVMMKAIGQEIRDKRPTRVAGFQGTRYESETSDEPAGSKGTGKTGCSCGGTCGRCGKPESEKTDDGKAKPGSTDSESKEMTCPECGDKMVDGVCKGCGYRHKKDDKGTAPDGVKSFIASKGYYGGMLPGSFEWVQDKLREQAKRYLVAQGKSLTDMQYVWLVGTMADKAVVCVSGNGSEEDYYQLSWKEDNGQPVFTGEPKAVQIQVEASIREKMSRFHTKHYDGGRGEGEKAGRVLSKSNYDKLSEVRGDMDELHEHCSTRSGKALCSKAAGTLDDVLKSGMREEEMEDKGTGISTAKDAAAAFLLTSTPADRRQLKTTLDALVKADSRDSVKAKIQRLRR